MEPRFQVLGAEESAKVAYEVCDDSLFFLFRLILECYADANSASWDSRNPSRVAPQKPQCGEADTACEKLESTRRIHVS